MKKVFIIVGVIVLATLFMSCNSRSGQRKEMNDARALAKFKAQELSKFKDHNVYVRFAGKDSEIPKDGQLLIIKVSLEDTIIVDVATLDDCRRVLEENGKG